ncbi:hypothetical protein G7048_20510 [Diaphorobacter sp. HDW4B]|uniref:hypothetical protein n=1 Tax=Diaphorobacter sp. HDW4B TaxID=2714925 RepID=UPI0014094D20|nr:hypothetical protein [Diaphorobacter sp. HDW4B]QIL72529.1 hypothetical protein G7048_20510 [Diaphorobacter sp. HDW4B]
MRSSTHPTPWHSTAPVALGLLWIAIAAHAAVNGLAPQALNADVILNSVMSLQNVTLFYWGQSRLLNAVALLASFIRDPALNLYFILYLNSVFFLLLLWMLAHFSCMLATPRSRHRAWITTACFVTLTSLILLAFHAFALFDLIIGHPEYTLSLLLQGCAVMLLWQRTSKHSRQTSLARSLLAVALVFLSVGINPATLFTAALCVVIMLLRLRAIRISGWILGSSTVVAFVFWYFVARMYGGGDYYAVHPQQLFTGLRHVLLNLTGAMQSPWTGMGIGVWLACSMVMGFGSLIARRSKPARPTISPSANASHNALVIVVLLVFAVTWILFFSAHTWVERNAYHWRYFTFALFAMTAVIAIQLSYFMAHVGSAASVGIAIAFGIAAIGTLHRPFTPIQSYEIYKKTDQIAPQSQTFYSGDYWTVWPVVHRDMMRGAPAFGLTYRGIGNAESARAFIQKNFDATDTVIVQCVAASNSECDAEIQKILAAPTRWCVQQIDRSECALKADPSDRR